MELTEFVEARLDDEQRKAELGAGGRHDHLDRDNYGFLWADPARVLAQVAAMRAIVDLHQPGHVGDCRLCLDAAYPEGVIMESFPCQTLDQLAAIWSDHPDYDPAWAPDA